VGFFKLNRGDMVSEKARKALRIFKSFISALKIKAGDLAFSIDIAFTAPLFEEFLMREIPIFSAKDSY
jgi:hypothetical protein